MRTISLLIVHLPSQLDLFLASVWPRALRIQQKWAVLDLLPKVELFFGLFLWQQAVGLFGWKGTIIYPIIKSNTIAGVPMQAQAEVDSWMEVLKRVVGVSVLDVGR